MHNAFLSKYNQFDLSEKLGSTNTLVSKVRHSRFLLSSCGVPPRHVRNNVVVVVRYYSQRSSHTPLSYLIEHSLLRTIRSLCYIELVIVF